MSSTRGPYVGRTSAPPTIGIFGHYGNHNLGDEATIAAVIHNVRARLPEARVLGFSMNPQDTTRRHGVPAYPIRRQRRPPARVRSSVSIDPRSDQTDGAKTTRNTGGSSSTASDRAKPTSIVRTARRALLRWANFVPNLAREAVFLYRSFRVLKNERLDVLMITGSNQFLDNFGGPWGFPYTLLKWSALGSLAGSRILFVCVGAGPVRARLSRVMIRQALRFSSHTTFRDEASKKLVEEFGYRGPSAVLPDLAFSLDYTPPPRLMRSRDSLRVGINPMPVYDARYWFVHDDNRYRLYVQKLADLAIALSEQGHSLVFWGTQRKDANVVDDVLALLEPRIATGVESVSTPDSVEELMSTIAACDIVVATRFHGVVLSLLAGTGVLALCYHRKQADLMRMTGQGACSVEFDAIDVDDLVRKFQDVNADLPEVQKKIRASVGQYRGELAVQYDQLFGTSITT